ncbi:MAG: VanZ family protein [Rhizobium sp.]
MILDERSRGEDVTAKATTVKAAKAFAWLLLAAILFVTVSPIGLRPHTIITVSIDRAGAYAVTALLFALAYPHRWKRVALLLVGSAFLFEVMQVLSPTRHAHFEDAAVKSLGVCAGLAIGYGLSRLSFFAKRSWALRAIPVRKD